MIMNNANSTVCPVVYSNNPGMSVAFALQDSKGRRNLLGTYISSTGYLNLLHAQIDLIGKTIGTLYYFGSGRATTGTSTTFSLYTNGIDSSFDVSGPLKLVAIVYSHTTDTSNATVGWAFQQFKITSL